MSGIGGFHGLRQCVWWKGDRLLAIGVREGEDEGLYEEEVLHLSLSVDRNLKTVTVAKW